MLTSISRGDDLDLTLQHIQHAHNAAYAGQRTYWYFNGIRAGSIDASLYSAARFALGPELNATSLDEVIRLCDSIKAQSETWNDEPFGFYLPGQTQPAGQLPRAAVSHLGLLAYGVHANGFTRRDGQLHIWVAKRSMTKPTFPGQWDNMVGGGLTAGYTHREILVKETDEEAGLNVDDMLATEFIGCLNYQHAHETGLRNDCLFVYDLELPESLEPHPKDGEVERFELWSMDQLRDTIRRTRDFKYNCNLVMIEFMLRHGVLDDHPDHDRIKMALDQRFEPA